MNNHSKETKVGAKPGNTNAQIGEEPSTSFIHARFTPTDKANWVRAAQSEGLKLTEWIVKHLNKSIPF